MNRDLLQLPEVNSKKRQNTGAVAVFSGETAHLVFEVDSQPYACAIDSVRHLTLFENVKLAANSENAPACQLGIIENSQTSAGIPLISLRAFWGLPFLSQATSQKKQAVLTLEVSGKRWALLVDECQSVIPHLPPPDSQFYLPAKLKAPAGKPLRLAVPWKQTLLIVIDLEELVATASTLNPGREQAILKSS